MNRYKKLLIDYKLLGTLGINSTIKWKFADRLYGKDDPSGIIHTATVCDIEDHRILIDRGGFEPHREWRGRGEIDILEIINE